MTDHAFKQFRTRHSLSQPKLGLLLGVPETSAQGRICNYELRRRAVPLDIARRFIRLAAQYGDDYTLDDVYPPDEEAVA